MGLPGEGHCRAVWDRGGAVAMAQLICRRLGQAACSSHGCGSPLECTQATGPLWAGRGALE